MRSSAAKLVLKVTALCIFFIGTAPAAVLLDETNIVGLPAVAAPSEHAFTVTTAEALTVKLTDLQTPAAFTALQIAVTLGDALVGSASVDATHTATVKVPAAAGNYALHVVGVPDSSQDWGSFGVCVTENSNPTTCVAQYSDSLTTPSTPSSNPASTLNTNFTSTAAGTYTITLTDDAFPVALQTVSAGVFQGATPILVNILPGTPTPITLAAGTTYQLLAAATANATTPAGLYGIRITDPSGAAVFDRSFPVGALGAATFVNNPAAQPLTLTLTDYAYPAALGSLGAAVTSGGRAALGILKSAGTAAISLAPAGSLDVWTYTMAATLPGVYGLNLKSSTANLLSTTQVVNPGNASTAGSFAFLVTLPAAGIYQFSVSDFQFPSALAPQPLTATIAQNGAVLTQNSTSGQFTASAGAAIVVVNAQAPPTGSGIFAVTVQTSGTSPKILLDQTQAVGAPFNTQTINLGTTGGYDVTLTDLGFPQNFQDLAVVVSQGSQVVGKIYGQGTFQFTGTPGAQYVLSFVATPSTQAASASIVPSYGLYSLHVASSAPTVTLKTNTTSVAAGGTVTLTWSSQDATACTASGGAGWTGNQMTSGTLAVVVSATETLTLTCTGPGGSAAQSVMVTATAAPSSGGGGAIDFSCIIALTLLWGASCRDRMRRAARRCADSQ